jgi:hypothetical protein
VSSATPERRESQELWSAADAQRHWGLASTGSARRKLSRLGIAAVTYVRAQGGRVEARYAADEIRSAAEEGRAADSAREQESGR